MLITRLYEIGVRGRMLVYLARWLQGQQASVKVGDACSAWFPVTVGLPEGGPPCPILFILMFNPVLRALDDIKDPDVGLSVPVFDARGNKTYEFRIVSASFADDSRFFARNRRGANIIFATLGPQLLARRVLMNVGPAKTVWLLQDGDVVPDADGADCVVVNADAVAEVAQEDRRLDGTVKVPATEVYRYLGCMESLDAAGCISYKAQLEEVLRKSAAHKRQLGASGTYQMPPALVGLTYMSLLQPSITYAMAVWNSDRHAIPELEADMVKIMQAAARVGARFPHAVGLCVTGMRSYEHCRDTLLLQCIVSVCGRRRGDAHVRSLITEELVAWERMQLRADRSQLWIDGVLALLLEVDAAIRWNDNPVPCVIGSGAEAGRPHVVERQWYGEGLEPSDPQPIRQYHPTVLRILKHWGAQGSGGGGALSVAEERDLVRRMDIFRYDAMQVLRYKRQVCAVWKLRSQVGIAHMNIASRPPPFAWCLRTDANRLRVRARGGVHALLGMETYLALRGQRVDVSGGDAGRGLAPDGTVDVAGSDGGVQAQGVSGGTLSVPACVFCKEPLTIPHLLRDCAALRDVRAQVWGEAQAFLQAKGSNGPLVRLGPTSEGVSHAWYLLTMGEECPRLTVMGYALEEGELAELRSIVQLLPACPAARLALERAQAAAGVGGGSDEGSDCVVCADPCAWCVHHGSTSVPDLQVFDGDAEDQMDAEESDGEGDTGSSSSDSASGSPGGGVAAVGKGLTLADLWSQMSVRQIRGRLRAQRRRRDVVRASLRLPTGQVVSGLASRLHLWRELLDITSRLLQHVVDRVKEEVARQQSVAAAPVEEPGVAPKRGRGRPRLPVVPGARVGRTEAQQRRENGERDPRGRRALSLGELTAAWLARKPAGVDAKVYVARMIKAREQAAARRSAPPGTVRRPRGRPPKVQDGAAQSLRGHRRGGASPPAPPAPASRQVSRSRPRVGSRGAGVGSDSDSGSGSGSDVSGVVSQPVPPVPVAPPRRSARQQGTGGGAVDVSASPVAPPLPRGQGVQQGKVRGQGARGGHGVGGGAVPLPMPPPRGSSLRGVGGGGGLGGRPASPPAPPVPMPRVSSKGRGSGGGGGAVDGRVHTSLQAAPAVRVTRAWSRAQTQDAPASQGQCTPSPPAPPGPTHLQGRQGRQPGRHR